MLGVVMKKRLSDERIATIFVNAILDATEKGFKDAAEMIMDDPAFICTPKINPMAEGHFTMIVIVGNLKAMEQQFDVQHACAIEALICEKMAQVFEMPVAEFKKVVKEYENYMNRVNHPSKNTLYAMSKAVFHKYRLNDFQDDYFKKMQAPNPLFLKRMDDFMSNFIWDWDNFFKKYKLSA